MILSLKKKYYFINVVLTGSTAAASCGVSENNLSNWSLKYFLPSLIFVATPGAVFKTLHSLPNLQIGPVSRGHIFSHVKPFYE
jgi:hypothetical protein